MKRDKCPMMEMERYVINDKNKIIGLAVGLGTLNDDGHYNSYNFQNNMSSNIITYKLEDFLKFLDKNSMKIL